MPSCSVVGCGYRKAVKEAANRGFKYQSFKLPKDPQMRELWLKQLNREDYIPTQNTVFCQKHFAEDAFVCEEENFNARKKPKLRRSLKKLAYPTLFLRPVKWSNRWRKGKKETIMETETETFYGETSQNTSKISSTDNVKCQCGEYCINENYSSDINNVDKSEVISNNVIVSPETTGETPPNTFKNSVAENGTFFNSDLAGAVFINILPG